MVSSQRGAGTETQRWAPVGLNLREEYRNVGDTSERSKLIETNVIRVRYWAAARSAAGVDGDELPVTGPISLAEVVDRVSRLHPDTRLLDVIGVCSVLLGDRPVSTEDPAELQVPPGSTLEFLPPFAGG
jgi:molybdopterin synthase sulfur carrier subunit